MTDVRTQREIARDLRDKEICDDFRSMTEDRGCRPYRAMARLAEAHGMTVPGIYTVLTRHGAYAKAQNAKQ